MRVVPRPLPGLIGFVAALYAGWGLHHLLLIGSCSSPPSDGLPACPPGSGQYFLAVFAGLFVAIPAIIVGGGLFVFLSIFGSIGTGAVLAARAGAPGWLYGFGAIFLAVPVLPLLAAPFVAARQHRARQLVEHGTEAIGTVLSVQDTGVTVNNNPRVRLRFRIEVLGGFPPPYEADKTVTVSRLAIPRVGDRYPVWVDPQDRSRWAFGTALTDQASPRVRRLFELARRTTQPTPLPEPLPGFDGGVLAELTRLDDLRRSGAISDGEFAERTHQILARRP